MQHRPLYSAPVVTGTRYRCAACGNLTRFDVEARRHTRRFLHFSLAGEPTVEEEEVLEETIERVTCRWCGNSEQIETIPAVSAE
ncbi:MAG: hypothetical protein E6G04_05890 [Actinobacteria bacterium]|nr:MAG: hypothetical protein E6G04_05890 [Actinomycetota bacterium]